MTISILVVGGKNNQHLINYKAAHSEHSMHLDYINLQIHQSLLSVDRIMLLYLKKDIL